MESILIKQHNISILACPCIPSSQKIKFLYRDRKHLYQACRQMELYIKYKTDWKLGIVKCIFAICSHATITYYIWLYFVVVYVC